MRLLITCFSIRGNITCMKCKTRLSAKVAASTFKSTMTKWQLCGELRTAPIEQPLEKSPSQTQSRLGIEAFNLTNQCSCTCQGQAQASYLTCHHHTAQVQANHVLMPSTL